MLVSYLGSSLLCASNTYIAYFVESEVAELLKKCVDPATAHPHIFVPVGYGNRRYQSSEWVHVEWQMQEVANLQVISK